MSPYVRYGAAVLIVFALALVVRVNLGAWTSQPPLVGPVATTTSLAASAFEATGYVDQTGIIVMDTTHGYPPVPFLQFVTADHGTLMKQLVFPWSRPCSPYAGDLPCVDTDEAQAYPQLPQGQQVRVRGQLKDDRILVYQVDPVQ